MTIIRPVQRQCQENYRYKTWSYNRDQRVSLEKQSKKFGGPCRKSYKLKTIPSYLFRIGMYYYRVVGTRVAGAAATISIFETCSRAVKTPAISIFGASDGPVYT